MKHDTLLQRFLKWSLRATPTERQTAWRYWRVGSRSKYMPHQGARECARRRRQMTGEQKDD